MSECSSGTVLFENGELKIPDSMGKEDAFLVGWKGKPAKGEIIHCPFIPKMLMETDEEREARYKRERAGKTYAKVKKSNPNPAYRCKRGRVVEMCPTGYCLEIETVNTTNEEGFSTLVGVIYPHGYEKIWFDHDEVEGFESYDEKGDLMK